MPALNLSHSEQLQVDQEKHETLDSHLKIHWSSDLLQTFVQELVQAVQVDQKELRLTLPLGWTLFWKLKEADTRLLLAHPEPNAWVATVAMTPEFLSKLIRRLSDSDAKSIRLSEIGALHPVSNFEIELIKSN